MHNDVSTGDKSDMLEIREVLTKSDRKKFIQFQNDLYRNVENYIPTLMMDEMANLDPRKNPAYDFCDSRQWLCYREGEIVGRVGAIISYAANDIWKQKRLRFTRIDFIEDYEVFCLLMKTVEDWARELGMEEVIGPMGFCDFDKEGLLVDGFDELGMFITYYNHPYYAEFLERYGYEKEVDWVENKVYVQNHDKERIDRICAHIAKKHKVRLVPIKRRSQVKPFIEPIFDLINEAYRILFEVAPITDRQKEYYKDQFLILLNLNYLGLMVDENDRLVCLGIVAPSFADALRKNQGRLFPFGWIPMLKAIRKPKHLDMYFVAVRDEYKSAGLPAVMLNHMTEVAAKNGVEYAETGPELEYNYNVQGLWAGHEIKHNFKRRRCYKRRIAEE